MLYDWDDRSDWSDPDHCLAQGQVSEAMSDSVKLVTR